MPDRGRDWRARIATFFVVSTVGLSQISIYDRTPNIRAAVEGSKTVLGYRLSPDARMILQGDSGSSQVLIRLPSLHRKAAPQLLGMLHRDRDVEIFLGWFDPESEPEGFRHHIEIFRGRRGSEAALLHDFVVFGGPGEKVSFFQPPDSKDAPTVLVDIQGGAYWGTTHLLAPDRRSLKRLFEASDYEFADLDRDGAYELIAWNRRPFDLRCQFGIFAVRFYPEVFVRADGGYVKAWPPADWAPQDFRLVDRLRKREKDGGPWGANVQVVAAFAALSGDGTAQLIVLQDHLVDEPGQSLAIYKLESKLFRLVAQQSLPPQRIAYLLSGIRDSRDGKQILVQTATPAQCEAGGDPSALRNAETVYILRGNRLQPYRR